MAACGSSKRKHTCRFASSSRQVNYLYLTGIPSSSLVFAIVTALLQKVSASIEWLCLKVVICSRTLGNHYAIPCKRLGEVHTLLCFAELVVAVANSSWPRWSSTTWCLDCLCRSAGSESHLRYEWTYYRFPLCRSECVRCIVLPEASMLLSWTTLLLFGSG